MKKILAILRSPFLAPVVWLGICGILVFTKVTPWLTFGYAILACVSAVAVTIEWRDKKHFAINQAIVNQFIKQLQAADHVCHCASDASDTSTAQNPSDFTG